MGKVKLFPTPEYTSKQPRDSVVPRVPCTGIFLGPSKSGKTVALISAILEQYRTADGSSVFERIYIFSPSIEVDDGWRPVKEFIEKDMGVNTEREQVYFDKWDEGALRTIIQQQRRSPERPSSSGSKGSTRCSSSATISRISRNCTGGRGTAPWTRCSSAGATCRSAPGCPRRSCGSSAPPSGCLGHPPAEHQPPAGRQLPGRRAADLPVGVHERLQRGLP